jgi:protein O-mannosyl-transferase
MINNKKKQKSSQPGARVKSSEVRSSSGFSSWFGSKPSAPFFLIIGLVLVVYAQTISFGFSGFDDEVLVRDNYPVLKNVANIGLIFRSEVFLGKADVPLYYRPIQMLSYMFDAVVVGANASSHHLSNVLLHASMGAVLFLFLFRIGTRKGVALFFALVFVVHPLFVLPVSWIPGRGDLLIGVLSVLSFISFDMYIRKRRLLILSLHLVTLLLAVLSKETAVMLPLLLVVYSLLFRYWRSNRREMIITGSAWFLIMVLWYILRSGIGFAKLGPTAFGIYPMFYNIPTIAECASKLILPIQLSPVSSYSLTSIVTGSIVLLVMILWAMKLKKLRDKTFLFGLLWFILFLAPGLAFRCMLSENAVAYDYLAQRFYLPTVGLVISVSRLLPNNFMEKSKWALAAMISIICVCGVYSSLLARNYSNPARFYDYAISANPESSFAYDNRGDRKRQEGDLSGALADLNEAVRLVHENPHALNNRGIVYDELLKYSEAIDSYGEAIRFNPGLTSAYSNRGLSLAKIGRYAEATKDFNTAIVQNPSFYKTYNDRGITRKTQGDSIGALADYNKALELKPDFTEALVNRGRLYKAMKQIPLAEADFRSATHIDPGQIKSIIELGHLYLENERTDDALKCFSDAIAAKPGDINGYLARAMLKKRLRDFEGAVADMDQVIRIDPSFIAAYNDRGSIHEAMNKLPEALHDFSETIRINPGYAVGYMNRGLIRMKLRDIKGAREDWSQALHYGYSGAASYLEQYGK